MIRLRYIGEKTDYEVSFKGISPHIVQITGNFPIKNKGFVLFRSEVEDDPWDYKNFKTIYQEIKSGAQFSDDESVYIEPRARTICSYRGRSQSS